MANAGIRCDRFDRKRKDRRDDCEATSDSVGGTIADSEINELWWVAKYQAALMKVSILGYDGIAVLFGEDQMMCRQSVQVLGRGASIRYTSRTFR